MKKEKMMPAADSVYPVSDTLPENYELNLSDFALFLSVMQKKEAYESTLSIIMDEEGLLDSPVLKAGKKTKYRQLPGTAIIFITQEDIFGKDLAMYTFTEQCEEVEGLKLEDGTKKIFLNMTSRNGRPELVSLLQYMKSTRIDNPEMTVRDRRIEKLDKIVREVKQSEEWEAVKMNILEIGLKKGLEQGREKGLEQGIEAFILDKLEDHVDKVVIKNKLIKHFQITEEQAEEYYGKCASRYVK